MRLRYLLGPGRPLLGTLAAAAGQLRLDDVLLQGLALYGLGALLFAWGGALPLEGAGDQAGPPRAAGEADRPPPPGRWARAALVLLLASLPLFWLEAWTAWLPFLGGAALLLASARRRWRWPGWGILAVLLLAALPRLWALGGLPWGVWWDEADNALHALRIRAELGYKPVFVPSTNLPSLYLYLTSGLQLVVGEGVVSVRLASALLGLVGVLGAYLLAGELAGHRAGLLAALLMAGSRWHLTFSRLGLHGVATPALTLLTAYLLVRAVRRRALADYLYAGAALALGMWFYAAFRVFPLVLGAYLLAAWRLGPRPARRGLAWLVGAAVVLAAPIAVYAAGHPDLFWARAVEVSILPGGRLEELTSNLRLHLGMFHLQGDPNGRHNLPGRAMLSPPVAVLSVLGLAGLASRWRRPEAWLLGVWPVVMLMPAVVSVPFEAPQSLRAIGALPVAYVLAGLALEGVTRRLEERLGRGRRAAALGWAAALALTLGTAAGEIHTYFFRQMRDPAVWEAHSAVPTLIARRLEAAEPGTEVYLSPVQVGQMTLRYLAPWLEQRPYAPALTLPLETAAPTRFYLDPRDEAMMAALDTLYPAASRHSFSSPWGEALLLHEVVVEPSQISALWGLQGGRGSLKVPWPGRYTFDFEGSLRLDGRPLRPNQTLDLAAGLHALEGRFRGLAWNDQPIPAKLLYRIPPMGLLGRYQPQAGSGQEPFSRIDPAVGTYWHLLPLARPYTIDWRGELLAPRGGLYVFQLRAVDRAELRVAGLQLISRDGLPADGEVELEPGWQAIELRFEDRTQRTEVYLYWTPPGGGLELVPPWALRPPSS